MTNSSPNPRPMAAAAAAAYPPWVMLEHGCTGEVQGCSSSIADTNTLASCRTTSGDPISVALCLAAPPEGSRVCVQLPAGVWSSYAATVIAAHGDSVVIQVTGFRSDDPIDHFVYSAGDAAAEPPRPPSLSLLPPHRITYEEDKHPYVNWHQPAPKCNLLHSDSTGLLRYGEGDFLVAELKIDLVMVEGDADHRRMRKEAALHVLRSSSGEWRRVKRPVIRRYADGAECANLASVWRTNIVIPVGDRVLCWVDLSRGLLFSDEVFDESPSLRYVPFPDDPNFCAPAFRNVCVTGNGSTLKFVNVFPRCCCGGAGKSYCRGSHDAYAIHTWTLRMDDDDDDMAWAMDGTLDATHLWALDEYKGKGLPRVQLDCPVVSMEDPNAICFVVCENHHKKDGDETVWQIMVDMKSRTLGSVFRYPEERRQITTREHLFPSRVSNYFNSKPSSGQAPAGLAAQAEAMPTLTNTRIMQAAASPESAILAALQEIPGLGRDDMLKAYRILVHDDSRRRFRGLMGLPMDLRKECVLMETKASEACVLCSACSADFHN